MSKNTDYKIKNVAVSTNGRNEIYFDVEWEGNDTLDCYELRVLDQHRNYLQSVGYAEHNQRVIVKNYDLSLKHKTLRSEVFHIEIVAADYVEREEDLKWRVLASYEPIKTDIYYEAHIFHKNILELR
jgi:hypothetical protein